VKSATWPCVVAAACGRFTSDWPFFNTIISFQWTLFLGLKQLYLNISFFFTFVISVSLIRNDVITSNAFLVKLKCQFTFSFIKDADFILFLVNQNRTANTFSFSFDQLKQH